ncbi:MAG: hypothetical protein J6D37_05970 [Clostridia bacterium]|nr:hypothetical protein [Clostridia bacterium]
MQITQKGKTYLIPLILTLLSGIVSTAILGILLFGLIQPRLYFLLFLFPVLLAGLLTFFSKRGKLNDVACIVLSALFLFASLFAYPYGFFFTLIIEATTPVTHPVFYERTLRLLGYEKNEAIAFFPPSVPKEATGVSFYYMTGIAMAGTTLELCFTDEDTVNEYLSYAKAKGISPSPVSKDHTTYTQKYKYAMPETFECYLLFSDNSNHGEREFFAVDEANNEILFCYENW